jgi:alpha-methylacyl-CoA racemase
MVEQLSGPLAGMRVVEFDARETVPLAGMLLADLGADVVRIRRRGANAADVIPSLYRGRLELTLDLSRPAAAAAALDVIEHADALIEGFAPGLMEQMGLGPDTCLARNPGLAYCRLSGWGRSGPLNGEQGSDINYLALSGALHAIGSPDAPAVPLALIADFAGGGMALALGLVSAVLCAQATGIGQVVDVSKLGGSATLMSVYYALLSGGRWTDRRAANMTDGGAPFYRCYRCADGRHIAVGALEPNQYGALCDGLGIARDRFAQYDRSHWETMAEVFAGIFAGRTRDAWEAHFTGGQACVTPVLSLAEAPDHFHNRAADIFGAPLGPVQPMPNPRFSKTPLIARASAMTTVTALRERWKLG